MHDYSLWKMDENSRIEFFKLYMHVFEKSIKGSSEPRLIFAELFQFTNQNIVQSPMYGKNTKIKSFAEDSFMKVVYDCHDNASLGTLPFNLAEPGDVGISSAFWTELLAKTTQTSKEAKDFFLKVPLKRLQQLAPQQESQPAPLSQPEQPQQTTSTTN
jgi:hypothetical protein